MLIIFTVLFIFKIYSKVHSKVPRLLIAAFAVRLLVLVVPLPGIASTSRPIASCTNPAIQAEIGRLAAAGKEQEQAIAALSQCRNAAGALLWELANSDNDQVRSAASTVLGQIATPEVIKSLASSLFASDARIRRDAAQTLGNIGWEAESTVPDLITVSQKDGEPAVRKHAVLALAAIVRDSEAVLNQWSGWQVGEIQDLQTLQERLQKEVLARLKPDASQAGPTAEDLASLQRATSALQRQLRGLTEQPSYQAVSWIQTHPWMVGGGLLLIVILGAYGSIFLLKPIWLLKLGDGQIKAIASIPKVGTVLSGLLEGLSPLKHHPRVLDAWIAQHLKTAADNFTSPTNQTVNDRAIHVPLPVKLNGTADSEFGAQTLKPYFQRLRFCVLITGEGGAGKTSLACQIARWGLERKLAKYAILPILIEQELEESRPLLEEVQGYLQTLVATEEPLDQPLVAALLRKRRLIVIVDHLSEMSKTTRDKIRPADPDFPIYALIITSRLPEKDLPNGVKLEPRRVEGNRLSEFINAYLTAKAKRHLFEDEDYFEVCRRLSRMVGQRNITVLLARLYADQTIEQQEGAGGTLPDSVPDLMLSYLNQLNRAIESANQCDQLQVQQNAQAIGWKCLEQTYRPTAAKRADVIAALEAQGTPAAEAESRLTYLEARLRLLQTLEPGNKLRIVLDPLAEYLAANYLVAWFHTPAIPTAPDFLAKYLADLIGNQADLEAMWRLFLASIDSKLDHANETPEAIQGFLLAVRDCCLVRQAEGNVPAFVPEELARKAGLDPEELQRAQEKRRIRLLMSELSAPELKYRIRAADDLSQLGASARMAAPNLIGMLENQNQTPEARQAAAQALGKLSMGAESLLTLLNNSREELAVRRSAAEALGLMKVGKSELLQVLEDEAQPLPVRQGTARALSLIGAPSGEPVPMLIVTLPSDTQVKSIPVYRETLADNLTLDLVAIPAGEFLMGSPPDEAARDWYKYVYPELEGVDVEAQHQVTVPAFSMSQFPITQAQWRFVAGLPKINRDLEPDPANFKGDRRPVEVVSWYEAIEFCDRLSQHTGKTYRLPSESEWEYACRAVPSPPTPLPTGEGSHYPPFHFGETLSTDFANYNGTYTYGDGEQGEYRQQTTIVGSFGVVNAFGLSDMHGNVWEWCLDHWHPSYEGAPIDGSAWMTEGDSRYRLLRGGSWYDIPGYCRSANRDRLTPDYQFNGIGFRVVCVFPWTL